MVSWGAWCGALIETGRRFASWRDWLRAVKETGHGAVKETGRRPSSWGTWRGAVKETRSAIGKLESLAWGSIRDKVGDWAAGELGMDQ